MSVSGLSGVSDELSRDGLLLEFGLVKGDSEESDLLRLCAIVDV